MVNKNASPEVVSGCGCCEQRRKFLQGALSTVGVAAISGSTLAVLSGCGSTNSSGGDSAAGTTIPNSTNSVYAFAFSQYPQLQSAGSSIHVSVSATSGTKDIYVTRLSAGQAIAVSTICTHAGCQINSYDAGAQQYLCPCHNSVFAADGSVVRGPANSTLTNYSGTISGSGISFMIN